MPRVVLDASPLPAGIVEDILRSTGLRLGDPQRLCRTRYDTFDARLRRAGLQLESRARDADAHALRATGQDGPPAQLYLATALPRDAPLTLAALPRGPLRARLLDATGGRALLPQVTVTSQRSSGTLDADGIPHAVVHLDTDLEVEPGDGGALSATIEVEALPGRAAEAAELREQLTTALARAATSDELGAPLEGDALTLAADRSGVDLRGWRGPVRPDLDRRTPALEGVRAVLRSYADALDANWQGAAAHIDDEFLHDLRIAVRQTRSLLAQSRRVLPKDVRRAQREAFRWLGTVTSPARDLDVYVAGWADLTALLDPVDAAALEPVLAHLAGQRAEAHGDLARALGSAHARQLLATWRSWLALPEDRLTGGAHATDPLGAVMGSRILAAQQQLLERGHSIDADSTATEFHELRKDGKRLRYLLESFGALGGKKRSTATIAQLRQLQDNLGAFQDAEVQAVRLRTALAELADAAHPHNAGGLDPATLQAGERLATVLDQRREEARDAFEARFAAYNRKPARRILTELVDRMSR